MGVEPITPTLQESVAPTEHASPFWEEVRPGLEPGPRLYHRRVRPKTPTDLIEKVVAPRIELSATRLSAEYGQPALDYQLKSERRDLNPRPPGPRPGAIPDFATF